ncbi:hypothetical protein ACWENO_13845 [Streptomyces sp. NPDC004436]
MLNLLVAGAAALTFALWLRASWYIPVRDGLALATTVFVIYLLLGEQLR